MLMRAIGFSMAMLSSSALLAQGLPSRKVLSLDIARAMADTAIESCRAAGYKVSVTVLDANGTLKAFLRDDDAMMSSIELSRMKANWTIQFGRASGPPPNLAPGAPVPPPVLPGTSNLVGALPIKVGDQLIGAIAVSGAPDGAKDVACVSAGLDKVAADLK